MRMMEWKMHKSLKGRGGGQEISGQMPPSVYRWIFGLPLIHCSFQVIAVKQKYLRKYFRNLVVILCHFAVS